MRLAVGVRHTDVARNPGRSLARHFCDAARPRRAVCRNVIGEIIQFETNRWVEVFQPLRGSRCGCAIEDAKWIPRDRRIAPEPKKFSPMDRVLDAVATEY